MSPERAARDPHEHGFVPPFQGSRTGWAHDPGRCPGLVAWSLSGSPERSQASLATGHCVVSPFLPGNGRDLSLSSREGTCRSRGA